MRKVCSMLMGMGLAMVLTAPALAAQSKCLVAKNKCVAKKIGGLLKCEQKAATPGKPSDPDADGCVDKVVAQFDGGSEPAKGCFEKLESKAGNDCLTFDDTASVEAAVDQCVADLVAAIDAPPLEQTKCEVAKSKCVAKKLSGLLKCHQKAQTPGKPTDPNTEGCIDKVKAKFDGGGDPAKGCVSKLELKSGNDCAPPLGNQAALETLVDACVDAIIATLDTPSTTTTTAPITTSTAPTTTSTSTATPTSTTSTSAPTTSSTTTTTSSSTTTTLAGAACSANGLTVTLSLSYPEGLLGGIKGIITRADYQPPVSIPGSGNVLSVRQRVTNLVGVGSQLTIMDLDTNTNGVDDRLEVQGQASLTGSIRPGPVYRARYDCAAGTVVSPATFTCALAEAVGLDGFLFPPEQAALIQCSLALAAAP